jgi:glycerophosphoryl diester phosphodiesterase
MGRAPSWLTARPIAHRGLHDRARGIVENMPGAMQAAIAENFAIECDVQLSRDGEAMVHHDDGLGRLTEGTGSLRDHTAAELKQVAFKDTGERMLSLGELCDLVGGRVPLVIEAKSQFDGDSAIVTRMAQVLAPYRGPAAVMSFDPDKVIAMRHLMPDQPRGIVAQRDNSASEWPGVPADKRAAMDGLRHGPRSQPHFVSYRIGDLPSPAPWIARHLFGCVLICWTVRTPEQRARAARHADQVTFEGYVPEQGRP